MKKRLIGLVVLLLVAGCLLSGCFPAAYFLEALDTSPNEKPASPSTSLDSPLPFGEFVTKEDYCATVRISIGEVIRGEEANAIVAAATPRYDEPHEKPSGNQEYMIVKMKFVVTDLAKNDTYEPYGNCRLIYKNGLVVHERWESGVDGVLGIPDLDNFRVARAGEFDVVSVFLMNKDQDPFFSLIYSYDDTIYFSLK